MAIILDIPCQDNVASPAVDDVSASNNNGIFSQGGNSADYSTTGPGGLLVKAFDTDGADDINLPAFATITLGVGGCIQFFAKRDSTNGASDGILSNRNDDSFGLYFGYEADNTVSIYGYNPDNDSWWGLDEEHATGVDTTQWHHYAFLIKANNAIDLYVDGVLALAGIVTITASFSLNKFGSETQASGRFPGQYCGLLVYNSPRTQPQIATDALIGGIGESEQSLPQNIRNLSQMSGVSCNG